MKWKCKDGTIMELEDMTDQHIKNALKSPSSVMTDECREKLQAILFDRENKKAEIPCPWCGHKMKMKKYEWEDPYPDVGISFPVKWKQLTCAKCKAMGPRIDL